MSRKMPMVVSLCEQIDENSNLMLSMITYLD